MSPESEQALPHVLLESLERESSIVYVLDSRFRLVYCNEAWDRFARENRGERNAFQFIRGAPVLKFFSEPLKSFYEAVFREAFRTGEQWTHTYECSTPHLYRTFRMRVLPIEQPPVLIVVNSLESEHPHGSERRPREIDQKLYRGPDGFTAMCSNCRRVRRIEASEVWDWVPGYIAHPPDEITHTLCPVCLHHFFPQ